jgi:WD40 repeat protein
VSHDGHQLALGSDDGSVALYTLPDLAPVGPPRVGHERFVGTIAFTPDDEVVVSGSDDQTIRIWRVSDAQAEPMVLEGHTDNVTGLALLDVFSSPRLASASEDGSVIFWDLATGRRVGEPVQTGAQNRFEQLAAAGDEEGFITVSTSRSVLGPAEVARWELGADRLKAAACALSPTARVDPERWRLLDADGSPEQLCRSEGGP